MKVDVHPQLKPYVNALILYVKCWGSILLIGVLVLPFSIFGLIDADRYPWLLALVLVPLVGLSQRWFWRERQTGESLTRSREIDQ
jgi:hypothetical protein